MFVKYSVKLFFQFHLFAVVSDLEPQPFCHQHHHYLHHIAVVVIVIFVPIVSILFYNHHFHYLICFWVVKQRNNKEAGTCTFVVNLNDQLSWFSFLFYVSTLNSPQKLRSSHWWLSTSMWWVRLFFECTSYHSTSRCQILQKIDEFIGEWNDRLSDNYYHRWTSHSLRRTILLLFF